MTREELRQHCARECDRFRDDPSGKLFQEHKMIMELLDQTEECGDAISREHLLGEIALLKKSPWYNNDTHAARLIRKDAVEMIEDLCIKREPPVYPKPKWITVSEKLPEEETDVMICNSKGDIEIARGSVFDDGTWEWYTSGWHYGEVVAWMPLPEPFEMN